MGQTGADCFVVPRKRRNGRGGKGAGHPHRDRKGQRATGGTRWSGWEAAAFAGWHEPCGAVKLVDVLAGESPASAECPGGAVVISGDGAGDQTVGSPEVNALVGWMGIWSAPTGGQTKQQVVAQANRSKASKIVPSPESECEDDGNAETVTWS